MMAWDLLALFRSGVGREVTVV